MRILHIYTMYIIHIYWIERGSGCLSCFGREPKSFLSRDLAVGGIWHAMKRGLAQNIAKLYSFFHKTAFGRLDTNCQVRCDGGLGGGILFKYVVHFEAVVSAVWSFQCLKQRVSLK